MEISPFISEDAISYLDNFIVKNHCVFEYGSGYSTLWLAQRCKSIVSIEHDRFWHEKVSNEILNKNVKNAEVFFIEADKTINRKFYSDRKMKSFEKYVKKIMEFNDEYFDIIMIDGRARPSCVEYSIKKVKNNGILILDDSRRDCYSQCLKLLSSFKCVLDSSLEPHYTRIWQK